MLEIITTVYTYFASPLGLVELAGCIANLVCVYLATKHNIWTWGWGIVGVLLFGYLFFQVQLYSDVILQLAFFLPMQFAGWYAWSKYGAEKGIGFVNSFNPLLWVPLVASIGILTFITGFNMIYVGAAFPYLDASILWMSVFAQILLNTKYWQSWALWVAVDVVAIYVYAGKGLVVTSGLYAIFLVIAALGLIQWYRQYKTQTQQ